MITIEKKLQKIRMRKIDKKYWSSKFIKNKVNEIIKALKDEKLSRERLGMSIRLSYWNPYEYNLIDQAIGKRIALALQKRGFTAKFEEYDSKECGVYTIAISIAPQIKVIKLTDAVFVPMEEM